MARDSADTPSVALALGPTVTIDMLPGDTVLMIGTVYLVQWPDGTRQPIRVLACETPQHDGRRRVQALLLPREDADGIAT